MPTSTSHRASRDPRRGAPGGGWDDSQGGGGEGGGGGGGGEGPLVKVAFARNQPEAELIQGLLRESGIPSVLKRARGFDAPEFLAAGPHEVYVGSSVAEDARRVLAETIVEDEAAGAADPEAQGPLAGGAAVTSPVRLALWVGGIALAGIALIWILYQLS